MDDKIVPEPHEIRNYPKSINSIWNSMTPEEKSSIQAFITGMPNDMNRMRTLLRLSSQHIRMAFGEKKRVAIVGPTNVGKSTLFNELIIRKSDKTEVSPIPGTTRISKIADSDLFFIVDTPGADSIGETGEVEQSNALMTAKDADLLIIMFDAIQGIKKSELDLYLQFKNLEKPTVVVINKIDLVKKHQNSVIKTSATLLKIDEKEIVPLSAKTGDNLPQLLAAIASKEPALLTALGQSMPQFRWQLAWRTIISAATISAAIALTPFPFIDFAPLVINQSIMVLGISRIYDYKITFSRARELVITFGLAFLGRTIFYELSKLGGIPGWLLSAAIASSTTVVMGYAASIWFEKGVKVSRESLKSMTSSITKYLLDHIRIGNKTGKKSIHKEIKEVLEGSPLGSDPNKFKGAIE